MRNLRRLLRFAPSIPALAILLHAGCGETDSAAPAASSWQADPAALSKLGPEQAVLGGRYTARLPESFEPETDSTDAIIAFKSGEDELMFQSETGIPERVSAEQFIADNRRTFGLLSDYPGFQGGEIESGTVGGMPAYRFRFTYDGPEGTTRSGFYYVASRPSPGRHMLIIAGDAPADLLPTLEAAALSTRPSPAG